MCDMMGTEPIPEDTPVDLDELPFEIQQAINIYNYLQDQWDYMNGNYIGKNFSNIRDILRIFGIEDGEHITFYKWICELDRMRAARVQAKNKAKEPAK